MQKQLFFTTLCLLLWSCHLIHHKKVKKQTVHSLKDSLYSMATVKSYEPMQYKGKVPGNYYTYDGFRDWWRYPLVYPYSTLCIDVTDYGGITNDLGKVDFSEGGGVGDIEPYFDKFAFDRHTFVGHIVKSPFDNDTVVIPEQYVFLSFSSGKEQIIKGRDSLNIMLRLLNFKGDTSFISFPEYADKLFAR